MLVFVFDMPTLYMYIQYRSLEPNIGPKVLEITSSPAEIVAPPNPPSFTSAPPVPPSASMSTNTPPPASGNHMTISSGLLPNVFNAVPPVMSKDNIWMGFPSSVVIGDEPIAKTQRMDVTDGLIPKQEFIALHPVRVISV